MFRPKVGMGWDGMGLANVHTYILYFTRPGGGKGGKGKGEGEGGCDKVGVYYIILYYIIDRWGWGVPGEGGGIFRFR